MGGLVSKVDEITNILTTNRVDIGAVTKSWLHDGIDTQLIQVPGYNVYRRDRGDGRSGGGVLVYVKNGQPCVFPYLIYRILSLRFYGSRS